MGSQLELFVTVPVYKVHFLGLKFSTRHMLGQVFSSVKLIDLDL